MIPITVKTIEDEKELALLRNFMLKQPQFYPNYQEWVDGKCASRIDQGRYKSLIVLAEGRVMGNAVYQFLEDNSIEIKNFRIDSNYRNRDLGHFLLTQLEVETETPKITLDVTVDNFLGVQFFIRNQFSIKDKQSLYSPTQQEYIMNKKIKK